MLKSMTGFGRAERQTDGFSIKVNMKSVNHKNLDLVIRTPRFYGFVENKIRQNAIKCISRGKVEVFVSIEPTEGNEKKIILDKTIAGDYINALRTLAELGIEDDVKASTLAQYPDIFTIETTEADEMLILSLTESVFEEAAEDFINMRTAEGGRMEQDICCHLGTLEQDLEKVKARYPQLVAEYRERLYAKLCDVLDGKNIDESRILTEAAIFAEKSDIDEETVRLSSHITEFRKIMKSDCPIGKKLDFVVQEMNRETNTMGSKAGDVEITKLIIDMKSEIEKIREQIQNVE